MEAKIGDRVSVDAKKVGQPRRTGVISKVTKGLSGVRYQVRWDDGHESVLSPGAGILNVERSGRDPGRNSSRPNRSRGGTARGAGAKRTTPKAKAASKRKAKAASKRKAKAASKRKAKAASKRKATRRR